MKKLLALVAAMLMLTGCALAEEAPAAVAITPQQYIIALQEFLGDDRTLEWAFTETPDENGYFYASCVTLGRNPWLMIGDTSVIAVEWMYSYSPADRDAGFEAAAMILMTHTMAQLMAEGMDRDAATAATVEWIQAADQEGLNASIYAAMDGNTCTVTVLGREYLLAPIDDENGKLLTIINVLDPVFWELD